MTDLTEKWKKGELPSGWYYINSSYYENGSLMWCENGIFIACGDIVPTERITEVLEPVPSYEKWQKHRKTLLKTQEKNCDLEIINAQLKALLKEVGGKLKYINTPRNNHNIFGNDLMKKINQTLGEEK